MPNPSEFIRILGAWMRDDGVDLGDLAVGSTLTIEAGPSPTGLVARWRVADVSSLGHWAIAYDGESPTPAPIFVENAEGVMDVLEVWVVP
jgi:hypothetical protein